MASRKVMIDTNIVSYLMKGVELARLYMPYLQGCLVAISFVTVGELYYGAEKKGWGPKKIEHLESTLRQFVVIPYDYYVARCYARIVADRERIGRPISYSDAWIAACAVRHGVPLITHNSKDFIGIFGLNLITVTESSA